MPTVRISGVHLSSFGPNLEACDMSWECLLCRHVPRLNAPRLIGSTDSEIVTRQVLWKLSICPAALREATIIRIIPD